MAPVRRLFSWWFVSEYVKWLLAPVPFLLPWLLLQNLTSNLHKQPKDAVLSEVYEDVVDERFFSEAAPSFLDPLFMPNDWTNDSFFSRLSANASLWFVSYVAAWGLCMLASSSSQAKAIARLKFNPEAPPGRFVLQEMRRSVGGLAILTALQVSGWLGSAGLTTGTRPTWRELLKGIVAIALWGDFHFYVVHRTMHSSPLLYRHIHKMHHESRNTNPWSGLSMHPAEHMLYFSALLLPHLLPSNLCSIPFWITNALSMMLVVNPIPAHIAHWPFERHHWEHHTEFNYNFGSSLLWDVLCGTTYEGRGATGSSAASRATAAAAAHQRQLACNKKGL